VGWGATLATAFSSPKRHGGLTAVVVVIVRPDTLRGGISVLRDFLE